MRLSAREKWIVIGGGIFLLGVIFWLGVWEPVQGRLALLERRVGAKRTEYRAVRELATRFAGLKERIEGIESNLERSRDFSILSYLESQARRQKVQDRIVQMKPKGGDLTRFYRENTVEIKMQKVRLPELVRYLYQIESSPELLRIKQLQVKPRFDDPDQLDVRFQVSAFETREAN